MAEIPHRPERPRAAPKTQGQVQGQEGQEERLRAASPTSSRRSTTRSSRSPTSRGNVVAWSSAGVRGFKGSRKSTPFAAQLAAEDAARKAMEHGMRSVSVFVKGPGAGRESALRALPPPASRSRSSATSRRSRTTAAGRRSAAASRRSRENHGSLHRPASAGSAGAKNMKLFLKGERCYTDKCAYRAPPLSARPARPGPRASSPSTASQLREKQKVRRIYGLLERQFRGYFHTRDRAKGMTGEKLLQLLERRLDNVVYRLGFAADARRGAPAGAPRPLHGQRQAGRTSRRSSCKPSDKIEVQRTSRRRSPHPRGARAPSTAAASRSGSSSTRTASRARVKALPAREDLTMPIHEQLIVEFYSQ